MTLGELLQLLEELKAARKAWMDTDVAEGEPDPTLDELFYAVAKLSDLDLVTLTQQAAQYAQTLREMAVAASMPRPDAVRQARIDKLRAVADWLAPTGEQ